MIIRLGHIKKLNFLNLKSLKKISHSSLIEIPSTEEKKAIGVELNILAFLYDC